MKFSLWPDSIKARVTMSALGVFLLSLWVLAFLTTRILERDISQLVADAQASATSQMAAQLNRELGSRLVALERIATGINTDMIENPDAVQHLLETQPLLQDLFNVSVLALNKNGISIADVPFMKERIGVNYRDRVDAFVVALDEGRTNIGNPLVAPTIGVPLIPLAVPIRDDAGEVIGALGGAIDLSRPNFFDDITSQSYGRTGYYSVLSKSRRMVVTSSNPDLIMAALPPAGVSPALDRAIRGEEGSGRYISMQGIDSLATVQGLEVTDWLIATITPISEAYKPIKDMQWRMTLITLVVTLLVGCIIWWILQRQLSPMLSTVEALGQMTQYDQSLKSLPLTGGKEINKLIGSFNRLLHVVNEREQELQVSEDALRHQNVLFNVLLNNIPIGVFMVEAPSGKPLIANQAAQDLLGRGVLPEASGENLSDVYRAQKAGSGEPYPLMEMPIIQGMSGHVSHVDDMLVERPDATKIQLEVYGTPVRNDNGEVWASLVSFYDITERKRIEEEKEKLQSQLNQALKIESVGRLAGGVAHDFNNMLGVILGYTQLALRKIGPDEPLYAHLKAINKAAERSSSLTQQLLAFARRQTVAPKVLDLNETVNDMLKMLRRLIGEDMDLAWRPGHNLGSVFIDPSQVDQILTNLCINARDAIADTGKITIETASVSFDEAYCDDHADVIPGDFVMLAVSDDGCGMDANIIDYIFEPFFSTKEMGKGTGLGLATVYGIVKQNNGFINVYSEPGHGTTFRIYLPQHADKAPTRPEQEQAPVPAAGGETILLVEDESAILEMTTIMLEEMGYVVFTARSPKEAIRLAREHHGRIDLLMTDVVMPEMNGRDLAGNLMSIYPGIRCLFMSGYTANAIAHHGVLDPGVHFLQKPFSMQDMAVKITEALDQGEANHA